MKQKFFEQIVVGVADFEKWKGNDLCVTFPFITDLHSHLIETDPLVSVTRVTVDHLELLAVAAKQSGADFAADLGDDGFEVPLKEKAETDELLAQMEKYFRQSPVPLFHCIGNHDHWNGRIDSAFWGSWQARVNDGKLQSAVTGTDGAFGFYDVPGKKCRVFFLNTSDGGRIGFSEEEQQFLKSHLAELPEDHVAVILTHVCPLTSTMWKRAPRTGELYRIPELSVILRDFAANGGRLAGVFSGNSHLDFFDRVEGVNYFVSQGYGGINPETEFPGNGRLFHQYSETLKRTDTFDSSQCCFLELVGIKPEKNEIRLFRIGAGGFDYHRGAKF